jgi:hypothetical protein
MKAKWEGDKAVHSTQECPLCSDHTPVSHDTLLIISPMGHNKEMHHHVYSECAATRDLRTERDKAVESIIEAYAPTPRIPVGEIPKWFSNTQAQGQSVATRALATYNKNMGALAFCPSALPTAL